jgi:hypothetical protein
VVLGEFDRFVFACGEEVRFSVRVSECDPRKVHSTILCELLDGDTAIASRLVPVRSTGRRLSEPGAVCLGQVHAKPFQTRRLTVRLTLEDGTVNHYPLWVFPQYPIEITGQGITRGDKRLAFVKSIEEAKASAVPAIVIPDSEGKLPAAYASDFWCYPMFRSISESMGKPVPIGTLGLCIDAQHPWLKSFAQEDYTTPAWYSLIQTAHCEHTACTQPRAEGWPIVQMVDNTERCQRLCLLWAEDGVPHMTFRLWENPDDIAVQAFAASLLEALT